MVQQIIKWKKYVKCEQVSTLKLMEDQFAWFLSFSFLAYLLYFYTMTLMDKIIKMSDSQFTNWKLNKFVIYVCLLVERDVICIFFFFYFWYRRKKWNLNCQNIERCYINIYVCVCVSKIALKQTELFMCNVFQT